MTRKKCTDVIGDSSVMGDEVRTERAIESDDGHERQGLLNDEKKEEVGIEVGQEDGPVLLKPFRRYEKNCEVPHSCHFTDTSCR